jgi:hypothetical protein
MKLHEGVDAYVEGRRTYGAVYPNGIQTLSAFCRYAGNVPLDTIRERQVAAFFDGPAISEATWQIKYKQLRNFFLFWLARNAISAVPLPLRRPSVPYTRNRSHAHRVRRVRLLSSLGATDATVDVWRLQSAMEGDQAIL